jgi:hypothetical protein
MRALLPVLTIAIAACGTTGLSSQMASWQGVPLDDVVSAWGAPEQCSLQSSRQLCVWLDLAADGRTSCTRMLEVDDRGVVIGWRWRGDGCDLVAVSTPPGSPNAERVADSRPPG